MLREEDKLTDALIQIIQSLPETKREKIARNITDKSKLKSKPKRKISKTKTLQKKKMLDFISHMNRYTGRLPKDYKFDREEANQR